MKRLALALAFVALGACQKAEQQPAQRPMSQDTSHMTMMADTSKHMMADTSKHMMADTSKHMAAPAKQTAPAKKTTPARKRP